MRKTNNYIASRNKELGYRYCERCNEHNEVEIGHFTYEGDKYDVCSECYRPYDLDDEELLQALEEKKADQEIAKRVIDRKKVVLLDAIDAALKPSNGLSFQDLEIILEDCLIYIQEY
tara:strand:- start:354 stop:704 length:351 start_codon:yes stop_codon:yes gene_type:complete